MGTGLRQEEIGTFSAKLSATVLSLLDLYGRGYFDVEVESDRFCDRLQSEIYAAVAEYLDSMRG